MKTNERFHIQEGTPLSEAEAFFADELTKARIPFYLNRRVRGYYADFSFPNSQLICELEGRHHYYSKHQQFLDRTRHWNLTSYGYRVIYFSNTEVFRCSPLLIDIIRNYLTLEAARQLRSETTQ